MMKSTLIKDLYGEIERLKAGEILWMFVVGEILMFVGNSFHFVKSMVSCYASYFSTSWIYAEVYATREKNGVYIPKERYYQEESEKKVRHSPPNFFLFLNAFTCFCTF